MANMQSYNACLPIHSLPTEALEVIFELVPPPSRMLSDFVTINLLRLVCSHWNKIITGCPRFWCQAASWQGENFIALTIARSGDLPLTFFYGKERRVSHLRPDDAFKRCLRRIRFANMMLGVQHRWRKLHITVASHNEASKLIRLSPPSLQSLSVYIEKVHRSPAQGPRILQPPPSSFLTDLSLSGCFLPWDSCANLIAGLKSLKLQDVDFRSIPSHLLGVLGACAKLQRLDLDHVVIDPHTTNDDVGALPIPLWSLSMLKWHGAQQLPLTCWWSHISSPSLAFSLTPRRLLDAQRFHLCIQTLRAAASSLIAQSEFGEASISLTYIDIVTKHPRIELKRDGRGRLHIELANRTKLQNEFTGLGALFRALPLETRRRFSDLTFNMASAYNDRAWAQWLTFISTWFPCIHNLVLRSVSDQMILDAFICTPQMPSTLKNHVALSLIFPYLRSMDLPVGYHSEPWLLHLVKGRTGSAAIRRGCTALQSLRLVSPGKCSQEDIQELEKLVPNLEVVNVGVVRREVL